MVRVVRALLKEDFADEELARRDLDQASLQGQRIVASDLRVLGGFLSGADVGEAVIVLEEGVDAGYLGAGNAVDEGDAAGQPSFLVLLNRPETFLHRPVDLFRSRWVHSVEEVLETAFVLVVRQVDQLFKFLFKAVPEETVMNAGDSGYVDADNPEVLHLLSGEAGADEVDARAEPAVLGASLFKADVAPGLQLRHQPVNVLLRHLVDLLL